MAKLGGSNYEDIMKKLLFIPLLFLTTLLYASPNNSMSILPVAVDRETIEANDENDRNSTIASAYNAHNHTDITQLGTVTTGVWNGTAVPVLYGGTGSTTASTARTALGVAIGSDVQAYDADLGTISALANTDSNFIVGNGSAWVAESGATARTSLGLGSLATLSTINNDNWSGTDLAVANGGTGASTATAAKANLEMYAGSQLFTGSGTFTAPTGVTTVYLTMVGGGGGGGGSASAGNNGGSGGGGSEAIINYPYTVTPTSEYAVAVGAAGTAGAANGNGGAGGNSSFDSTITATGGGAGLFQGSAGAGGGVALDAVTTTAGGSTGIRGGNGASYSSGTGGAGGASIYGTGGAGGAAATGYGSGGGGATAGGAGVAGGAGTIGFVLVQY